MLTRFLCGDLVEGLAAWFKAIEVFMAGYGSANQKQSKFSCDGPRSRGSVGFNESKISMIGFFQKPDMEDLP
jgi:hypothetical protein